MFPNVNNFARRPSGAVTRSGGCWERMSLASGPTSQPTPPLAAIGILSHGGNQELRGWIRRSWLAPAAVRDAYAAGMVVRFVLRGTHAPPEQVREAEINGDVAFVDARADLRRGRGPLLSLFLWWRLALAQWPGVQLIGKADGTCVYA
jgi:hypothetical protein